MHGGWGLRRRWAEAQADLMNPNPMFDLQRKAEEGGTVGRPEAAYGSQC